MYLFQAIRNKDVANETNRLLEEKVDIFQVNEKQL